jgi:hypothetical protein
MSDRNRARGDGDNERVRTAEAVDPKNDPVFTYDEVAHGGASFGVSNETITGALVAAGFPRTARLTRQQVSDALKAFAQREVQD